MAALSGVSDYNFDSIRSADRKTYSSVNCSIAIGYNDAINICLLKYEPRIPGFCVEQIP
jgi:hypothetical protein